MVDWDTFRRPDGSIRLADAFVALNATQRDDVKATACVFLGTIERLQPISSRQAAATALQSALWIADIHSGINVLAATAKGRS